MHYLMIAPLGFLKQHRPDYPRHMVLAQHWKGEYAEYFKRRSIVLDNGEYEEKQVPLVDYIRIAMEAEPFMAIAPDCMHDMGVTLIRTQKFMDYYPGNADILGVVQGRDLYDRLKCYSSLVKMGVQAIGFPRCWKRERVRFINLLKDLDLWSPALTYSALGWTGSLHEVRQLAALGVTYIDTSAPVWRGLNGWSFSSQASGIWNDIPFDPLSDLNAHTDLALNNLQRMEEACKSESETFSPSKGRTTSSTVLTDTKPSA